MNNKTMLVRLLPNGNWFTTYKGKHITLQETITLLAKGISYSFVQHKS